MPAFRVDRSPHDRASPTYLEAACSQGISNLRLTSIRSSRGVPSCSSRRRRGCHPEGDASESWYAACRSLHCHRNEDDLERNDERSTRDAVHAGSLARSSSSSERRRLRHRGDADDRRDRCMLHLSALARGGRLGSSDLEERRGRARDDPPAALTKKIPTVCEESLHPPSNRIRTHT